MTSTTTWLRLSLAFALAGVLAMPAGLAAQADTRIAGTVRDGSGSSVANAQVSVKNDKTGEVRQATTNQQGYFIIGNLKPSVYTIKVEMTSFAPLEYPQMEVRAAQELGLDFESAAATTRHASALGWASAVFRRAGLGGTGLSPGGLRTVGLPGRPYRGGDPLGSSRSAGRPQGGCRHRRRHAAARPPL